MSRLGDLESAIVTRLAAAAIGGAPVFAAVKAVSGDYRAVLRDAMLRERPPAACVAFVKEPTAPETFPERLGAQFSVFVLARALRQSADPRRGDSTAPGAFTLIDAARTQLDNWQPSAATILQCLDITFKDADDRHAIYELRFRAWPVAAMAVPDAPGSLAEASSGQPTLMKLAWQAPVESATSGRADFYRLYRKGPGDAVFKLFETSAKDPTSRLFAMQAIGTTVQYYVTAVNVAGESAASNTLTVET